MLGIFALGYQSQDFIYVSVNKLCVFVVQLLQILGRAISELARCGDMYLRARLAALSLSLRAIAVL